MTEQNKKALLTEKVIGQFTQHDINTLKSTLAAGLNTAEFNLFVNTAAAAGLNPFLKQIIPVVYEGDKGRRFDIQVPVEGIEHLARQKTGWRGYEMQLIHEHDNFSAAWESENWIIKEHVIKFPRGKVLGGYCIAFREGFKPTVIFMGVEEVEHLTKDYKSKKMWEKWFNDMFKKHIKKRALREMYGIEVDDMQDLTGGPDTYNDSLPESYNPQQRQDINQEQEEGFDEAAELQALWDKIGEIMEKHEITEAEAEEISKSKLYAPPTQLKPQQVAAFCRFLELEGLQRQAKKQKEAKQAASYQYREGAQENAPAKPDLTIDAGPIEKEPEQQPEPEAAQEEPKKIDVNKELNTLEDMEAFFDNEGQGTLF